MGMSGRCRSWFWLVTVMLLACGLLGARDLASAQEATTTATAASTAPDRDGSGAGEGAVSQDADLSGTAKAWLVGGLLVLAVVTVAMHYLFLSRSRQEYFRAAALLFRRGVYPRPVLIPAQGDATGALALGRQMESDGTIATLEVIGSGVLHRDEPGVYVALLNGARAEQAVWTIDPAAAATATPAMGAITNVTATADGTFSLMAAIPDQGLTTPPQTITVLPDAAPATDASPELPFIGQGFASLVGAVVLIAAVVVLAAIGVDDWEVIGTIFGALAGYLFGTATNTRG